MPVWIHKVNIKRFLSDDTDVEAIKRAYEGITKELKTVPMRLPPAWHRYAKLAIETKDVNVFNLGMAALYDWADEHRVWMGVI